MTDKRATTYTAEEIEAMANEIRSAWPKSDPIIRARRCNRAASMLESLAAQQEIIAEGKRQWDQAAALPGADGDNVGGVLSKVQQCDSDDRWALALRVREALDRKACPDAWMVMAVEAITGSPIAECKNRAVPPRWYSVEEIAQVLRRMKYGELIVAELAPWFFRHLQLAFNKGFQKAFDDQYQQQVREDSESEGLEMRKQSTKTAYDFIDPKLRDRVKVISTQPVQTDMQIDYLVDRFAEALREKLHASEAKYGYDDAWKRDGWQSQLVAHMYQHIAKGDPLDVAAYCAFAWYHGWSLKPAQPSTNAIAQPVSADRAAYEGARADLLCWKRRAQRAEATLRSFGYTGIDASEAPKIPQPVIVPEGKSHE